MGLRVTSIWGLCGLLAALVSSAASARAQVYANAPPGLETVGVEEHLDRAIPRDLEFQNHRGERVRIGDLIRGDRPVVLNLVYHSCPSFCSLVLDGTRDVLREQSWTVGNEFDVITVSIDPRDTPEVAADARRRLLYQYGRDEAEQGWHFLVAKDTIQDEDILRAYGVYPEIEALADAVGYRYQWVPRQHQYAHPGVMMILTPEGRLARYLYGIDYDATDVRLGLIEAADGNSISSGEQLILYCFQYDASAHGYVVVATRIMQIGGALTVLFLSLFLGFMWRRELRRKRKTKADSAAGASLARDGVGAPGGRSRFGDGPLEPTREAHR